MKLLFSA